MASHLKLKHNTDAATLAEMGAPALIEKELTVRRASETALTQTGCSLARVWSRTFEYMDAFMSSESGLDHLGKAIVWMAQELSITLRSTCALDPELLV